VHRMEDPRKRKKPPNQGEDDAGDVLVLFERRRNTPRTMMARLPGREMATTKS